MRGIYIYYYGRMFEEGQENNSLSTPTHSDRHKVYFWDFKGVPVVVIVVVVVVVVVVVAAGAEVLTCVVEAVAAAAAAAAARE